MSNIEKLAMNLAKECREKGLNFVIAIEENGIHSQSSVKGKSLLGEVIEALKTVTRK